MATLSAAQTANGATASTHTLTGTLANVTVVESVQGTDFWTIQVQYSIDGGTTWLNTGAVLRRATKDQGKNVVLPIGSVVRGNVSGLNDSTLKIEVL